MKLKIHTPADHIAVSPKLPVISFNPTSGRVSFSQSAIEGLALKNGDKIVLIQDEDRPKDWYLSKDDKGFTLQESAGTLAILNKSLSKEVTDSLGVDGTAKIPVAIQHQDVDGKRLFALLTKGLVQIQRKAYTANRRKNETSETA